MQNKKKIQMSVSSLSRGKLQCLYMLLQSICRLHTEYMFL